MDSTTRYPVLIVDDEPAALRSLDAVLGFDFDVTMCSSAREALGILEDNDFLVVCADYRMPEMDGLELLARVDALARGINGLLITGCTEVMSREDWLEHDYLGVVFKPYDPERLIGMVQRFARMAELRRKRRERRRTNPLLSR